MLKENRFQFFEFHGKCYGPGTIVKFKPSYMKERHGGKGYYGKYNTGCSYEGWHFFLLGNSPTDFNVGGMGSLDQKENEIYREIEKIIVPYEVPYVPIGARKYAYNDFQIDGMIEAWIIYILVMAVSSIFICRIIFWIVASVVFFGWRNEVLKQYGYK